MASVSAAHPVRQSCPCTMSGRQPPSVGSWSASVTPSLTKAWLADAVRATVSTGGSHGRSTAVRNTAERAARRVRRVGDPFGDRQHDDLVAGAGEARGEALDVRRRPSRGPRREVPRQHQHSHGLAPYCRSGLAVGGWRFGSGVRTGPFGVRPAPPWAPSTLGVMSNVARPIGELDLHLFGEGTHRRLWELLGPQGLVIDGNGDAHGVRFSVWAPNASRVWWSATGTTGAPTR